MSLLEDCAHCSNTTVAIDVQSEGTNLLKCRWLTYFLFLEGIFAEMKEKDPAFTYSLTSY